MAAIYWLIPISILLLVVALAAFYWAVNNGQFDDLDSPGLDILDDDHEPPSEQSKQ